ncbi:hypothetical protein [Kitasatospora sp. NBC_00458]|uniref:hypothetical protein n=1 Tax=Kitasatospora sp. NBC_00458 TaxID=2903568 RepID=UPI002E1762B9
MSAESAPPDLAHYYPGWIWDDGSVGRMKSLLLYFHGFALLLPGHHFETTVAREEQLAGPLHAAGLLHNLEPDTWLDVESAHVVQEYAQRARHYARNEQAPRAPQTGPQVLGGDGGSISNHHFGPVEVRAARVDELLQTGAVTRRRPDPLRRARRAWGRPLASLALAGAGAAWTLHQADPVGALLALSGAAASLTPPARERTPFTYLLEARRLG